ncbi:UDP-3-O-[3-hydroxymyristoyl] N-acetylglucosamine deacetylase [Neokomagataea thailandica NBRC 106555]|uniref:UDP-3-O-acyl-N-acetylglucosamine deacetylase n=2 Tax=Neokomagataea TaxID=1223423 RepID=A0A4Y6V2B8_9PROT|nr:MULTISPECIES: UDP-3-O-acyl-N-acetylglucosamine deacetylase [Neokomagataea]QDH24133.1 UDP-3-O-acyl-N-acetylglucosamine deacetylase [Neokomagataea tanensis]GBR50474.1 UDP-3-O-[3-hydroxymyristoyl] N-acetylglucosamine deacetylase [Neokomagataea thailandica NBRC 106555]
MQVTGFQDAKTAKDIPFLPSFLTPDSQPQMPSQQTTLANSIRCRGIALHSGIVVDLELRPAPADTGICFLRTDKPGTPAFPVRADTIVDTQLSTVVAWEKDPSVRVATIEHLMAALSALCIDNAVIAVSGPEMPVLDGSSAEFCFLIQCAGTKTLDAARRTIEILRPVRVEDESGAFAELRPSHSGLALAISLSFSAQAIGSQRYAVQLSPERFLNELAFCRTFVNRSDIEHLQSIGLARGGSLDNAIVVDDEKILNPAGLRIEREFARHKLLDAVGDLYCAGRRIQGGFIGHKSGHRINNLLLRAVFADQRNWRLQPIPSVQSAKTMQQPSYVAA